MKKVLLLSVRFYQALLSPDRGIFRRARGPVCRFSPSCSEYFYEAVEKYGIRQGAILGIKRISRCHPWHDGGYDPVPSARDMISKA